jgi:ABC-type Mn2+/Zn2+ transport system ATPase subunit
MQTEPFVKLNTRHTIPHDPAAPILSVANVSILYETGAALRSITFSVIRGERVAVIGPNGAGKSSLLKLIAGVKKASQGMINIFGHEPGQHICIAYVPQRNNVDWAFPVSVYDVVMMGRIGQLGLFRKPRGIDREIVMDAIETVGLQSLAKRQINQLSGGQQQRMFIARALAQQAELMLMDEPLTGLDANSQADIFTILGTLQARSVTVLVSLHDLHLASEHFDRVLLLNTDQIGFGTPDEVFTSENLIQAYGGHLHMVQTPEGMLTLGDTCCEGENQND